MSKYAVCNLDDSMVVNIIIATPEDPAPQGYYLVPLLEDIFCNIGWTYDGYTFINPNALLENTAEQLISDPISGVDNLGFDS